ncbi:MAG: hypothetical protein QOE33_3644 [Acidobacteriota bacterium]|jgi:hypothetical protein|nr:hypothetical protein [Acidobacteriota bacterium]
MSLPVDVNGIERSGFALLLESMPVGTGFIVGQDPKRERWGLSGVVRGVDKYLATQVNGVF